MHFRSHRFQQFTQVPPHHGAHGNGGAPGGYAATLRLGNLVQCMPADGNIPSSEEKEGRITYLVSTQESIA